LLQRAIACRGAGPYLIQAAIADLHLEKARDWGEIANLYRALAELTQSPVVEMNRAVALAETEGPDAALVLVDQLPLDDYRYFHSTRAELLRRLGRDSEASIAYGRALALSENTPERRFLERRLLELRDHGDASAR
jgi:RNA polymerase sigma-70 factor (ECF subfamily)